MKDRQLTRTTFAQDTGMTPGIWNILAKIADSATTVKQREEASLKYYKALMKLSNTIKQKQAQKKKNNSSAI